MLIAETTMFTRIKCLVLFGTSKLMNHLVSTGMSRHLCHDCQDADSIIMFKVFQESERLC